MCNAGLTTKCIKGRVVPGQLHLCIPWTHPLPSRLFGARMNRFQTNWPTCWGLDWDRQGCFFFRPSVITQSYRFELLKLAFIICKLNAACCRQRKCTIPRSHHSLTSDRTPLGCLCSMKALSHHGPLTKRTLGLHTLLLQRYLFYLMKSWQHSLRFFFGIYWHTIFRTANITNITCWHIHHIHPACPSWIALHILK